MNPSEGKPIGRILLVEDEELLLWSTRSFLRRRGYDVEARKDGKEGLERARSGIFDLVISDLNLQGVDGLSLTAAARESNPDTQVIIITGHGSKESVIAALRQGVWDYIEKPFDMELLLITVERALEKSRLDKELLRLSRTDGLTGLYNQGHFYRTLEEEMQRARRQQRPLSLILIDVDDFKDYNDRHGHLEGDEALVRLAACVRRACRRNVDKAFRYGGDEFVVVLPEARKDVAESVSTRIRSLVRESGVGITLSIGVTEIPQPRELRDVVREADEAMYLAKQCGGNRTVTFERSL